jgi:hypothetical protein
MKTEKELLKGHHGDVQIKEIESLPAGADPKPNSPLAYGEVSGHIHILTGDVHLFEHEGRTYAVVGNEGGRMQHVMENNVTPECMTEVKELPVADHKSILLPPGTYEFGIQKQFNPFEKTFEKVMD